MTTHEHAQEIIDMVAVRRIPVWLARARVESLPVRGSILHVRGRIDFNIGVIRLPSRDIAPGLHAAVKALRTKVLLRDAARTAITQTKERRGIAAGW